MNRAPAPLSAARAPAHTVGAGWTCSSSRGVIAAARAKQPTAHHGARTARDCALRLVLFAAAAVPKPPSPSVLLTLPTDPRGHVEPFLHVDLYSEKSIYDDGVLGVYAIACLGDGGAAGAAAGAASTP